VRHCRTSVSGDRKKLRIRSLQSRELNAAPVGKVITVAAEICWITRIVTERAIRTVSRQNRVPDGHRAQPGKECRPWEPMIINNRAAVDRGLQSRAGRWTLPKVNGSANNARGGIVAHRRIRHRELKQGPLPRSDRESPSSGVRFVLMKGRIRNVQDSRQLGYDSAPETSRGVRIELCSRDGNGRLGQWGD
jgi:hypothetical protein